MFKLKQFYQFFVPKLSVINAVVGIPGGGKSYLAAELINKAINSGRHVVTDMPLSDFMMEHDLIHVWNSDLITNLKYIHSKDNQSKYTDDEIEELFNKELDTLYPKGCLYVLDECWKYMKGGTRIDSLPKQQLFFFKKHRHRVNEKGLSDDIILVTQDLTDINATIRSMVENTILCVKPSDIGFNGFSVRHYMTTAIKGVKPLDKFVTKTETIKLKPEIFRLYESHTQSDNQTLNITEGSAVQSTFYQSFKFKLMIFGLISSFVFIAFALTHLNKSKDKYIKPQNQVINSSFQPIQSTQFNPVNNSLSTSQKPINQEPVKPSESYESSRWRILAVVTNRHNTFIYIDDLAHKSRRINANNCNVDDFGQYTCVIDKQIVSLWSGASVGTSISAGVNGTKNQLSK